MFTSDGTLTATNAKSNPRRREVRAFTLSLVGISEPVDRRRGVEEVLCGSLAALVTSVSVYYWRVLVCSKRFDRIDPQRTSCR
jgi:hypothetical protein